MERRRRPVPHALFVVLVLVAHQLQAPVLGQRVERREDLPGGVEGDGVAQDVDDAGGSGELFATITVFFNLHPDVNFFLMFF